MRLRYQAIIICPLAAEQVFHPFQAAIPFMVPVTP